MLHMMIEVRIPGVAHDRLQHIWEAPVKKSADRAVFAQNTTVVDMIVQHQSERSSTPHGKERMQNAMSPGKVVILGVRGGARGVQVETLVSSSWLSAGTRGRKQPLANHLARGGLESEEEAYQPALSLLGHRRAQPPQRVERLRDVDSPRARHRRVPSLGKNRNRMA